MSIKKLFKRLQSLDVAIKIHQADRYELIRLLKRKQNLLLLMKETLSKARSAK